MTWKRYALQVFCKKDETLSGVIEAPSPGAAIELFLGSRGLFCYDTAKLTETNETPEMTQAETLVWVPDIEAKAEALDKWHCSWYWGKA